MHGVSAQEAENYFSKKILAKHENICEDGQCHVFIINLITKCFPKENTIFLKKYFLFFWNVEPIELQLQQKKRAWRSSGWLLRTQAGLLRSTICFHPAVGTLPFDTDLRRLSGRWSNEVAISCSAWRNAVSFLLFLELVLNCRSTWRPGLLRYLRLELRFGLQAEVLPQLQAWGRKTGENLLLGFQSRSKTLAEARLETLRGLLGTPEERNATRVLSLFAWNQLRSTLLSSLIPTKHRYLSLPGGVDLTWSFLTVNPLRTFLRPLTTSSRIITPYYTKQGFKSAKSETTKIHKEFIRICFPTRRYIFGHGRT